MTLNESLDLLAFNLKLQGKKTQKNILISAGSQADKKKLLPSIRKLYEINCNIYATKGTSVFLNEHGIPNQEIFKISELKEPNIKSFLLNNRFDLILNILTNNEDYDASTDSKYIRSLAIKNSILLITDVDVGILQINEILRNVEIGVFKYKLLDDNKPWDLKSVFYKRVLESGGFACHHAHFDKAYLISEANLMSSMINMQKRL